MKFALWLHPEGHVIGYSHGFAKHSAMRYIFTALWNDFDKIREDHRLTGQTFDPDTDVALWREDHYQFIVDYDCVDEREGGMKGELTALCRIFDKERKVFASPRALSRYDSNLVTALGEMLRFDDDPVSFEPRPSVQSNPLPEIALLVGTVKASRYDFWEAR